MVRNSKTFHGRTPATDGKIATPENTRHPVRQEEMDSYPDLGRRHKQSPPAHSSSPPTAETPARHPHSRRREKPAPRVIWTDHTCGRWSTTAFQAAEVALHRSQSSIRYVARVIRRNRSSAAAADSACADRQYRRSRGDEKNWSNRPCEQLNWRSHGTGLGCALVWTAYPTADRPRCLFMPTAAVACYAGEIFSPTSRKAAIQGADLAINMTA